MTKQISYTYFLEKANSLIRKLAIGKGPAKERLLECEIEIILTLSTPVPNDLNSKREQILQKLTRKPEITIGNNYYVSSLKNTIRPMQNKTASKIIEEIYDLYSEVKFRQNIKQYEKN